METKDYATIGITLAFLVSLGFNANTITESGHNYFCENRSITYHCDSLSQYYSLPNGKCVNDLLTDRVCKTGWKKIYTETNTIFVSDGVGLPFKQVDLIDTTDFLSLRGCMLDKTYCGIKSADRYLKIYVSSLAECNPIIGNETSEELLGKYLTICNAEDMIIQDEK